MGIVRALEPALLPASRQPQAKRKPTRPQENFRSPEAAIPFHSPIHMPILPQTVKSITTPRDK